ncbi:T. brucei spp.-specific protein [Trypanosoma brucei gambiense DAL972]|uniref:T. brucei spp.-specific protein n=1 Tax=Trypanosoma brucei gambiense (strain MHOM/CI/86/DAL972) TaxID=679716 RepID=C9ZMK9_TRYB9|nr:T. brucei spp.-specific protein [Trypanosoma brucei gambiense DAL972]CBH10512.1 T. brucei spp.-specific protein [Trypanosoma brucei gambiense DAL972]|eukprot:XP_011772801.1 T. brucei spp.-specific protein [Trypanosoma brucei gambiense DAL972]
MITCLRCCSPEAGLVRRGELKMWMSEYGLCARNGTVKRRRDIPTFPSFVCLFSCLICSNEPLPPYCFPSLRAYEIRQRDFVFLCFLLSFPPPCFVKVPFACLFVFTSLRAFVCMCGQKYIYLVLIIVTSFPSLTHSQLFIPPFGVTLKRRDHHVRGLEQRKAGEKEATKQSYKKKKDESTNSNSNSDINEKQKQIIIEDVRVAQGLFGVAVY